MTNPIRSILGRNHTGLDPELFINDYPVSDSVMSRKLFCWFQIRFQLEDPDLILKCVRLEDQDLVPKQVYIYSHDFLFYFFLLEIKISLNSLVPWDQT